MPRPYWDAGLIDRPAHQSVLSHVMLGQIEAIKYKDVFILS